MGDPTKFHSLWEYYAFNVVFTCLLLSELFIFFYTRQRDSCTQTAKRDHGTKWLLYGNFAFCLLVSICSVSQTAPTLLRQMVFPPFVADIGTAFTAAGITIRLSAVLTLKKAFTLHVQTAAGQHLVRTGLYHAVRHPAYSGSVDIPEYCRCLHCSFLLPDLLQCKNSCGGKSTAGAVRRGIRRL